jgi:dihydroxyacetone kinase-like protein
VISGGGSGHEPLHSGFVGAGMLDAACIGEVFSSPTSGQILTSIQRCAGDAGVLLIVKNYMGDQLNFEIAAERAHAIGIPTRTITIDDDVSPHSSRSNGRRGVGLAVIAEKILGAAAETGLSLTELADVGERLRQGGRSMGIALTSCTHPNATAPTFDLGATEIEIGIGIHGELGCRRAAHASANDLATVLIDSIIADLQPRAGASFIALTNGMGGTPLSELYVMAGAIAGQLDDRGHRVDRMLVGSYITSLEMAGCSLTLLLSDEQTLHYWDEPVTTPALRWGKDST